MALQLRTFQTPQGEIWLRSDFASHSAQRPLVFAIGGSFPAEGQLDWLAPAGADVVLATLPGFFSPSMSPCRIETFAAAYSAVIEQAFADRRIVVLGVSAGALAALVLDAANVEALVLVEPFFSTAKLWTLVEALRSIFPNIDPAQRDWAWDVLGIAETRLEDRPYGHLLPPALPNCVVVVGDIPLLPRRPMPTLPSFTDDGDRAALVASGARLIEVAGGHAVPRNAPEAITAALEDVLRTLT